VHARPLRPASGRPQAVAHARRARPEPPPDDRGAGSFGIRSGSVARGVGGRQAFGQSLAAGPSIESDGPESLDSSRLTPAGSKPDVRPLIRRSTQPDHRASREAAARSGISRRTAGSPSGVASTPRRFRDARRITAAGLSAVIPGLGQLANGRRRLATWLAVPALAVFGVAALVVANTPPVRLAATVIQPQILDALLLLSLVLLAVRLFAVGHAFFDRRFERMPGRAGVIGLVIAVTFVALPHAAVAYYGGAARDAFGRFFETDGATSDGGQTLAAPLVPADDERLNVLLLGIDRVEGREATLTDTMMVASLDRKLGTVSLVSVPRDLVNVPLANGDIYAPKLNSLYGYAARHADELPDGPVRTLADAIGGLLGIRIHYHATLDFNGFADMIDAVGGVAVNVKKGFEDPTYDGYGLDGRGWSIEPGRQLLDGPNALAYARSRKALGESDFTRQERQQQILVALRDRVLSGGSLFFQLPRLLDTLGSMVRTDLPADRLPELAALADTARSREIVRVVIQRPLIKPAKSRYGSVQIPDLEAIDAMAAVVLPPPGTPAEAWPPTTRGSTAAGGSTTP